MPRLDDSQVLAGWAGLDLDDGVHRGMPITIEQSEADSQASTDASVSDTRFEGYLMETHDLLDRMRAQTALWLEKVGEHKFTDVLRQDLDKFVTAATCTMTMVQARKDGDLELEEMLESRREFMRKVTEVMMSLADDYVKLESACRTFFGGDDSQAPDDDSQAPDDDFGGDDEKTNMKAPDDEKKHMKAPDDEKTNMEDPDDEKTNTKAIEDDKK